MFLYIFVYIKIRLLNRRNVSYKNSFNKLVKKPLNRCLLNERLLNVFIY